MSGRADFDEAALAEDFRRLIAEDRQGQARLSAAEILDYLEGELDDEAAAGVAERLALDPEAAALALDLSDPERLPEPEGIPPWEQVREALEHRGAFRRPESSRVAGPARPSWLWAVAALLVISVGLGLLFDPRGATPQPSTEVEHWVLRADQQRQIRDGVEEAVVERGNSDWLVLILAAGNLGNVTETEVTLFDAENRPSWSKSAERTSTGTFDIILPAGDLAPGRYFFVLSGAADGRRKELAKYSFEVR